MEDKHVNSSSLWPLHQLQLQDPALCESRSLRPSVTGYNWHCKLKHFPPKVSHDHGVWSQQQRH